MDRRQRLTLLGIAAAIAAAAVVIALVIGGGDDNGSATTTAEATDTSPQTAVTTTQTEADPTEPPKPERTRIRVEGGEPVGGTKDIEVKKDDTVEIVVTADAADEAHLHGYDIEKPVGPGKAARFRFEADIEGVFELELHHSGAQIAKVTVEP